MLSRSFARPEPWQHYSSPGRSHTCLDKKPVASAGSLGKGRVGITYQPHRSEWEAQTYLTSRHIVCRRCAVGTKSRLGGLQSESHIIPHHCRERLLDSQLRMSRAKVLDEGQQAESGGRGVCAHPTRSDHRVLEHTAAELAAQLHRGLLRKHQWLLDRVEQNGQHVGQE